VRQATAHPIHENFRVEAFRAILQGRPTATPALLNLGELMFQSHASYRRVHCTDATALPLACSLPKLTPVVPCAEVMHFCSETWCCILQPVWPGLEGYRSACG